MTEETRGPEGGKDAPEVPLPESLERLRPGGGKSSGSGVGSYAGMGLQFAISILVFLYLGNWLDGRWGTGPLFLVIGVFVGAGAAFYAIYKKVMSDTRRK